MKRKALAVLMTLILVISLAVGVSAKEDYKIPMAVTPPTVDGNIGADEWNNALTVDVSNDNLGWILPQADGMNIGAGSYVKFMWDADYLYCAANIVDATYGVQPVSGGALNSGDGVQLCFYTDEAATNGDGTTNMFWDFLPRTGDGDASSAETYEHFTFQATTNMPIKSTVKDNGSYTLEWAIPWSLLAEASKNGYGVTYTGAEGTKIIMMITIMDHDGAATQSLGYSTDEWCVPATTDVYTLTSDKAGIIPAEPEPVDEAPVETPVVTPAAPATADLSLAVFAIAAAAATVIVAKKKNR